MNIDLLKGTQHFPFVKTGMLSNMGTLPERGFLERGILFKLWWCEEGGGGYTKIIFSSAVLILNRDDNLRLSACAKSWFVLSLGKKTACNRHKRKRDSFKTSFTEIKSGDRDLMMLHFQLGKDGKIKFLNFKLFLGPSACSQQIPPDNTQ